MDFFAEHCRYDSIKYRPPPLEEQLEERRPLLEIVFRMEEEKPAEEGENN